MPSTAATFHPPQATQLANPSTPPENLTNFPSKLTNPVEKLTTFDQKLTPFRKNSTTPTEKLTPFLENPTTFPEKSSTFDEKASTFSENSTTFSEKLSNFGEKLTPFCKNPTTFPENPSTFQENWSTFPFAFPCHIRLNPLDESRLSGRDRVLRSQINLARRGYRRLTSGPPGYEPAPNTPSPRHSQGPHCGNFYRGGRVRGDDLHRDQRPPKLVGMVSTPSLIKPLGVRVTERVFWQMLRRLALPVSPSGDLNPTRIDL